MSDGVEGWRTALQAFADASLAAMPLEPDRSASPERLARRAVMQAAFPPSAAIVDVGHLVVLRLHLDGLGAWAPEQPTDEARSFASEVRTHKMLSRTEPGGDPTWVVVGPDLGAHPWVDSVLRHALGLRVEEEVKRRRRLLTTTFDRIGWHEIRLRTPDGTPDPRMSAVARRASEPRPLIAGDLVEDLSGTRLLGAVPPEVDDAMSRARMLYLAGWSQWELFTLAAREAVFALEAGIRVAMSEEAPSTSSASFAGLIKATANTGQGPLFTDWERRRANALRQGRNREVHLDGQPTVTWISWARQEIVEAAELINRLWVRKVAALPVELSYEGLPASSAEVDRGLMVVDPRSPPLDGLPGPAPGTGS